MNVVLPARRALAIAIFMSVAWAPALEAATWKTVAPTNATREYPGLAIMSDGKILAVTGHPLGGKSLASAELYDVARDEWTSTGALKVPRNGVEPNGLITLPNGKVLITGGGSGNRSVHETELYDDAVGQWSLTGSMSTPRCVHTTTQLTSGDVLVAGGIDWITEEVHASAEVYDHKSGKWSDAGAMHTPRFVHRAIRLNDGNVLVTGGLRDYPEKNQVTAEAEIYDAKAGTWRMTAPMHVARRAHGAVLLTDGRVLVAGGSSGGFEASRQLDSVEIFDPKTETWTLVAPLHEARWGPTIDLLQNGKVLVTGGGISPLGARRSAELFDPQQGTWSDAGNLSQARSGHRSIQLRDGRVLIVGGWYVNRYLSSCELYSPD
jgi:hypothetical protein